MFAIFCDISKCTENMAIFHWVVMYKAQLTQKSLFFSKIYMENFCYWTHIATEVNGIGLWNFTYQW